MNRAKPTIIPMHQGINKRLTKGPPVIIGNRHPKQAGLQFLFHHPGRKEPLHILEHLKERLAEKFVNPYLGPVQNLKGCFMGRKVLTQHVLTTKKQQAGQSRPAYPMDRGGDPESAI
ncbi:MAG: hypothetical protein OEV91_00280 [Desulfobulbaceae bacterium]|nr:hypothetical protein [Desulfobulbaceae bacterium]